MNAQLPGMEYGNQWNILYLVKTIQNFHSSKLKMPPLFKVPIFRSQFLSVIIRMYCGMQQVWADRNKCKKYYSDLLINFQLNGPLIPPPLSSFLEHKQLEAHYFSPQKHRHVIFKKKKFGFMFPISQQLESFPVHRSVFWYASSTTNR